MSRAKGSKSKKSNVDSALKSAVSKMLKDVMAEGTTATLSDKCKVVDRALKLAAIEAKMDDPGYGTGFSDDPPEDE
jgi:hypothetical protein